jgi:hypothetical protein
MKHTISAMVVLSTEVRVPSLGHPAIATMMAIVMMVAKKIGLH